jgi:salicylate hydroxylase
MQLLEPAILPQDTGDVAYRILIDGKKMREDPKLSSLITNPGATAWCGPDAHIVGYPIRQGELYNMVICAKRLRGECESDWVVSGNKSDLNSRFGSWEYRLQRMFDLAQDVSSCSWAMSRLEQTDDNPV